MTEVYDSIKGIAFPFTLGPTGFPEPSYDDDTIRDDLIALVLTAKNEIPMEPQIGIDAYGYVFETMTAIDKAKLASSIASQIMQYETRVVLIGVNVSELKGELGTNTFVVDVVWKRAGQVQSLQVPIK